MRIRIVLALVALLAGGWTAVLLRDHHVGNDGVAERDPAKLESARFLNPSRYWDQVRAGIELVNGNRARAAAAAEEVVRDEPDNLLAWSTLRGATGAGDERRAEATAAIRRLNPLTAP